MQAVRLVYKVEYGDLTERGVLFAFQRQQQAWEIHCHADAARFEAAQVTFDGVAASFVFTE